MQLHPAQKKIVECNSRFRVLLAGRRFGKTILAVEELIYHAVMNNDARVVYIAPTFQAARDIALEQLKKRTKDIMTGLVNETRLEFEVGNKFNGKSKILLRSWDNIETLRGQYFNFMVLDEVAQYKGFINAWQEVLRPCLTDKQGGALFISTPLGFNHFYDLYNLQEVDKDYKSFHFTSYDNPHLPPDELEKARAELTEDRYAQEYLADFRKTQGLVYKEFDRKKHVYNSEPSLPNYMVYGVVNTSIGVDFGYTNPTAMVNVEQDTDQRYFVSTEYYKTGKTTPEIIEVARGFNGNYYYPDPAEPDRIEEMRRAGLNVREVSKDVEAGIQAVRELLKSGRLFIHSSCVNLISEFETYSYPDKKPDKNENEAPIKENDHALDALRYVLYMHARQGKTHAHTHYAQSAMPQTHHALPNSPKTAYTHIPRL